MKTEKKFSGIKVGDTVRWEELRALQGQPVTVALYGEVISLDPLAVEGNFEPSKSETYFWLITALIDKNYVRSKLGSNLLVTERK